MIYVSKVYRHPKHGLIYITSGSYESNGRISNFWHWKEVNPDGTLGKEGCDYWCEEWVPVDFELIVKVKVKQYRDMSLGEIWEKRNEWEFKFHDMVGAITDKEVNSNEETIRIGFTPKAEMDISWFRVKQEHVKELQYNPIGSTDEFKPLPKQEVKDE